MFCCGRKIKIEAGFAKDPIWCSVCKKNISPTEVPISQSLLDEIYDWNEAFSRWLIDYHSNSMDEYFELESKHNQWGLQITKKIKNELGIGFSVVFAPSNLSQYMYG